MLKEKGGGGVEEGSRATCVEIGVYYLLSIAFTAHALTCHCEYG